MIFIPTPKAGSTRNRHASHPSASSSSRWVAPQPKWGRSVRSRSRSPSGRALPGLRDLAPGRRPRKQAQTPDLDDDAVSQKRLWSFSRIRRHARLTVQMILVWRLWRDGLNNGGTYVSTHDCELQSHRSNSESGGLQVSGSVSPGVQGLGGKIGLCHFFPGCPPPEGLQEVLLERPMGARHAQGPYRLNLWVHFRAHGRHGMRMDLLIQGQRSLQALGGCVERWSSRPLEPVSLKFSCLQTVLPRRDGTFQLVRQTRRRWAWQGRCIAPVMP